MSEKIFIVGGTGFIGSKLVRFLLNKKAEITLYARNVEKTKAMYPESDNLKIVQGDYTTIDAFEREIVGHTRLFIIVSPSPKMPEIKGTFAKIAYAAGVRQIVDISSYSVNFAYRFGFISTVHREAEDRILKEKADDQFFVAIRPNRFFSNHIWQDAYGIKSNQVIGDLHGLDFDQDFISPTDIAELASVVLTEPVEKHANCVYPMIGETLTTIKRATILSEVLGKTITPTLIPMKDFYQQIISLGFPHSMAVEFLQKYETTGPTRYFEVIIDRPAQTFREWLLEDDNLAHFQ